MAWAISGWASTSTSAASSRPSSRSASAATSAAYCSLPGAWAAEWNTMTTGAVIDSCSTCWKFSCVIATEYAPPVAPAPDPAPAVGAACCGAGGRPSPERSMAPGRLNGCCVMGQS